MLSANMFIKFLVGENQFHNEIVAQFKISVQMDFYEYLMKLKKVAENQFHNEIVVQLKIPVQMEFYEYLIKLRETLILLYI